MVRSLLASALLLGLLACGSDAGDQAAPPGGADDGGATTTPSGTPVSGVWLVPGNDVDPSAIARINTLLSTALGKPISTDPPPATLTSDALVIAIGTSDLAKSIVPETVAAEGYVIRSAPYHGGTALVATGSPKATKPHGNVGALHGAYALLEELGFAFLHPLAPTIPTGLSMPAAPIDKTSAPRWEQRVIHVHSQHPLEMTDMLQGWGPGGTADKAGFEKSLEEWDRFLEWAVANGESGVEWFILWADSWKDFADSQDRIERYGELVDHAHRFGLDAGLDAPIAFAQQHSYRLLRNQGDLADEIAEIDTHLDWIMQAGFDFLGIESGTSEFTHPTPDRMLAWMNEVAIHLDTKYAGTKAYIKVHCSTGQTADGYPDPVTGKPINFNMLPHFADPRLGVLPHTVQTYGLTDPAPTYGNTDFGYIRDFTHLEAGKRPTVFYPESAYWVSFDIDVPLFLPLYADRRVSDLRLLAGDEDGGKMAHMNGQLVFSSGWEWGYWLNDVITARAAWSVPTDFRSSLSPVVRPFGAAANEVAQWLVDVVTAEQALLIDGVANGKAPSTVVQRNGQAYLQGWETWDDVNVLAENIPSAGLTPTQPDKLGLVDMRNPLHGGPGYSAEVEPILADMETTFAALASRADALRAKIPANAKDLFDDLADAMQMTALRAKQVHGLYDYVDGYFDTASAIRLARLGAARSALDAAQLVVNAREKRFRVPAARIASWRPDGPTAYAYGYQWTTHSLYYWWRDEGKAVDAPLAPCYLNIINPVDVAFGEGMGVDATQLFGSILSSDQSRGCLAEPSAEPMFPQDNLRSRP